jgi:GT2 family glycosyltransferase
VFLSTTSHLGAARAEQRLARAAANDVAGITAPVNGSFAVAIVSYNTRELLRACLHSAQSEAPAQIVVVDNASTDGSPDMVADEFPGVVLCANAINIGYGAAANQAVSQTAVPYVLLLNCDTRLQVSALSALGVYLDREPGVAIVGPRLVDADGALQRSCYAFPTPLNLVLDFGKLGSLIGRDRACPGPRAVPWVSGAALAVRRIAFESVGGFDESFFMYYEEVDLCYRLAQAGWQVHFAPVTDVVHVGGASTRQLRGEMAVCFFTSLQHFYARHYSHRRQLQLPAVVACIATARLARDGVLSQVTRDPVRKAELTADLVAWVRLLRGAWRGATHASS